MEQQSTSNGSRVATLFSIFRDVAFLVGIYAYFTGWVYVFFYYQDYRISLSELEIPVYYFIVYAFSALDDFWGAAIIMLALIFLVLFNRSKGHPHPIIVPLMLLVLFPILFVHARNVAIGDASQDRLSDDNARVVLLFREGSERMYPAELIENNKAIRLRLLAESKDRIIVFYQPPREADATPFLLVYDVSKQDLAAVKKLVANER